MCVVAVLRVWIACGKSSFAVADQQKTPDRDTARRRFLQEPVIVIREGTSCAKRQAFGRSAGNAEMAGDARSKLVPV